MADRRYRDWLVSSSMDDIVLTRAFNGLWGSYLRPSIVASGLDPDNLDNSISKARADATHGSGGTSGVRRWKDLVSAGHSVSGVRSVEPAAQILERTRLEYLDALSRFAKTANAAAVTPNSEGDMSVRASSRATADGEPEREVRPGSIEYWAEREPGREVVFDGDTALTWADLDGQANRVAEGLAAAGIRPGDLVGVRIRTRAEWIVTDAALAKLGCSNIGLNFRLTPSEVEFVLRDSGARGFICDDADPSPLAAAVAACDLTIAVSVDSPAEGFVLFGELLETEAPHRNSMAPSATIVYTSGTTGRPKGVRPGVRPGREQDALAYRQSVDGKASRSRDDTYLATLPFSHGAGPSHLRNVLLNGGRAVLMRRFDPRGALELIRKYGVTNWVTVPTMLKRIAALPTDVLNELRPTTLRYLSSGAAPASRSLKEWAFDYFGEILHESYGATEVGMISHASPLMLRERPQTSGKPYRHVEIEIRDDAGRALPPGRRARCGSGRRSSSRTTSMPPTSVRTRSTRRATSGWAMSAMSTRTATSSSPTAPRT
ncbi:AMP-binding protein [Streptomyces sp. CA-100214]